MARIYTSRVLLDPSLLSTVGNAVENRIKLDADRNRNVLNSFTKLFDDTGRSFDEWVDKAIEEGKQKDRLDNVRFYATASQLEDPLFLAAADEYARTGSSSALTNYQLQRETAEANRLERDKQNRIEKESDYPKYIEAVRKMNAELDKPVPDYELAEQYKAEADVLNKKHGYTQTDLAKIMEAKRKTAAAKAAQAAEDAAAEAMGQRNLLVSEELEATRQLNAQKFLSTIDTRLASAKTPEDRSAIMDDILKATEGDAPILTKEEAVEAITKARGTKTASEEMADVIKSAHRSNVSTDIKEKHEEKKKTKSELDKILDKQKRGIPLSSREKRILDESKGGKK